MLKHCKTLPLVVALIALWAIHAFAQSDGDALQLQTYIVESASDRPDVTDGYISTVGNLNDWKSAYARQIVLEASGIGTRTATIFFANDNDSLYLAVALPNDNNGANQGFFMYFDLDNDGILDGTPSQPGEYAISSVKNNATSASFKEYGWNGSAWVENTIATPGLIQGFVDNGAGGNHVYNFEVQIPFLNSAPNAGQAFFGASPGQEVGIMITARLLAGDIYWRSAGTSVNNTALWGELQINSALASPRRLSSLYAKSYLPDVSDGDITNDANWKYAFDKTVTFTDFAGNKLNNCRILIKEAAGTLYFGARITDNVSNNGDYFQIYFDQGNNGGALNYQLSTAASARKDDAIRVAGNSALTDLHFDGSSWVTDGTNNVNAGAATFIPGTAWEFEIAKPLTTADVNDLSITSGTVTGILFRYYDADNSRDYWWSGTINNDRVAVDLSGNYNALGWAELATGGPFMQPLYPEQNDIISGTFPLMIHTEDEDGITNIDSVDYRITDLNDNIVINYSSSTRLTKVDNSVSGLWVSTFNSNTPSTPDGDYNIVFRVLDDDGIRITSPVKITIQNSGTAGGPTVSNVSLQTGDVVAGRYRLTFDVSPTASNTLVPDSIMISIDGGTWSRVDSTPAITGGTGRDSVNTVALNDGVHTIRLRAKDTGDQTWGYSDLIIFNVNNTGNAPNVRIDSISGGSLKSGTVTVNFTATAGSNSNVDSSQISIGGLTWVRTTTGTSHILNTTLLVDGTRIIQIRAFGSNNTTGYSRNASIITSNAPAVTLSAPAADSVVSGTLLVTFTATPVSPATIASTWISVDGGTFRATSTGSTDTLDTKNLTDGSHTIQIKAVDSNGKDEVSITRKFVIRNKPMATVIAPAADTVVSGTLLVTFTATPVAPATIASTWISVDGGAYRATSTGSNDTLDTRSLTDGSHTIQIKAVDSNGKDEVSIIRKFVIRNKPTVTVTAPTADTVVSGTLLVTFTATPVAPATIASTWISVDGGSYRATSTGSNDTLDTRNLTDGSHTIQIKAVDSNGKDEVSIIRKFVIRNKPTVTVIAPAADSVVSGTLLVTFTATPVAPATIASTWISVDGGAYRATSTGSNDTLDTRSLTEGSHIAQIKAIDSSGKEGFSDIRKFVIKNTPSVVLVSPVADTILTGTVSILFSASAVAPASIVKRNIFIDGKLLDTATTDSTYIWNTLDYNDGQHSIQVRVIDSNGKTAVSDLITVTLFNTPIVTIIAPNDTSGLSGIDTIRFTVNYPQGSSRDTTEVAYNGGLWLPSTTDSTYIWITTDFPDGNHIVQVRATATNGKTGYSQIRNYGVKNAPAVNITAPTAGEALNGVYTIRYTVTPVSPAVIAKREISIDGGKWYDSLTDTTFHLLNTSGMENGTHSVQVRGYDNRGRIGFSNIRMFVVDNEAPLAADPKVIYTGESTIAKSGANVLVTILVKDNLVGLKADSSVILTSASIDTSAPFVAVMHDDGLGGDKVKGDNVFSSLITIRTDSTGAIGYSVTAADRLGNDTTVTSAIILDNTPPVMAYVLNPVPEKGIDIRSGTTYFRRLVMKGSYSDIGGSGLSRIFISVKNDSGDHVNSSPVVLAPEDLAFSRVIELIPGKNTIMLHAKDKAGNCDSIVGTIVYYEPKATKVIDRKGGTVDNPDGASVAIPANAVLDQVEVTIVPVEPVEQRKPLNKTLKLLNVAHDFGPDGTTFRIPVTVKLPYTEADLDLDQDGVRDVNPTSLIVVFWDGSTWHSAGPSTVDAATGTVSVNVNHFTIFDLAVSNAQVSTELITLWTANPVKNSKGAFFKYKVPEAGTVGLRIVDMAGDLVYQLIADKTPASPDRIPVSVEWRGQNVSERFAGVGMYVYIFTYTTTGTNKTTVIRKPIGVLK